MSLRRGSYVLLAGLGGVAYSCALLADDAGLGAAVPGVVGVTLIGVGLWLRSGGANMTHERQASFFALAMGLFGLAILPAGVAVGVLADKPIGIVAGVLGAVAGVSILRKRRAINQGHAEDPEDPPSP